MTRTHETPVERHRRQMRRKGLVRVEVRVRKGDAPLLRSVAVALLDPEREAETRALLRAQFQSAGEAGLKALLAAAPLEGIDLERPRDTGRTAKL